MGVFLCSSFSVPQSQRDRCGFLSPSKGMRAWDHCTDWSKDTQYRGGGGGGGETKKRKGKKRKSAKNVFFCIDYIDCYLYFVVAMNKKKKCANFFARFLCGTRKMQEVMTQSELKYANIGTDILLDKAS